MASTGETGSTGGRPRARARKRAPAAIDATPAQGRSLSARTLLVSGGAALGEIAGPILGSLDAAVELVASVDDARARLGDDSLAQTDVVVIDASVHESAELLREVAMAEPQIVSVLATDEPSLDLAVDAMKNGAVDLMTIGDDDDSIHAARASLALAIEKAQIARHREGRVQRLRSVCRQLNSARQDITSQVSGMCNDLVEAYQELSGQIDQLALCGEFNGVIRQELEIESLLRTALEFMLAKLGPTNAAVYLPATSHDFSLGAYVNCDLNKDTLDTLLDQLADVLAPRFEHRPGVHVFESRVDTAQMLGSESHWLPEHTMIVFPCHQDDECLAVVALFRDDRTPFEPGARAILETISKLFASQLARIIHVHHRHLPKHQWGAPGDGPEEWDEPDDIDLAA